ncbi:uncharacterized protein LOC118204876 [Stegodyphus dumicola]|uniref:uncharacterized protein LOC118204876 n=1 Tax=Stegodyphus dumicola TaxID=202533 RepID=UPI0015A8127F|nr:uncharacterized protein LOC118204876 [Stegodyphus dumicola]
MVFALCICLIPFCIFCKWRPDEDDQWTNPAFDNQDERPMSVLARIEPPPCYEDAMKYNAVRGILISTDNEAIKNMLNEGQRPNLNRDTRIIEMTPPSTVSSTSNRPDLPHNAPALTTECGNNRSRSGTGNNSAYPHLSTVSEEVDANLHVTVGI